MKLIHEYTHTHTQHLLHTLIQISDIFILRLIWIDGTSVQERRVKTWEKSTSVNEYWMPFAAVHNYMIIMVYITTELL